MGYTHFKDNLNPSFSDVIRVDGQPQNITGGTVRFRMREIGQSALKVDELGTITDGANGAVRYDWSTADVDTAADFLAWWHVILTAKTQDTPEFLLTVLDHQPGPRALCYLEDVYAHVPGLREKDTVRASARILRLIASESRYIHTRAHREFTPKVALEMRSFDVGAFDAQRRLVAIGDLAGDAGLTVTLKQLDGSTVEVVASANYVLIPRVRESWEPVTDIWFPSSSASPAQIAADQVLEVAVASPGSWGFPEISEDLRQECARNVASKFLRSTPVSEQMDGEAATQSLRVTYRVTDSYRTHSVG